MRQIHRAGITLLAAAMIAMLVAASASASEFQTAPSASVDGVTDSKAVFSIQNTSTTCSEGTLEGVASSSGSTPALQMQPGFAQCIAFGLSGATVDTAGCSWILDASADTVDLTSCSGGGMEITVQGIFNTKCEVRIPNQNGAGHVYYVNSTNRDAVNGKMNLSLTADVLTSTGICPLAVKNGQTMEYTAEYSIVANEGASSIWVGAPAQFHADPVGAALSGSQVESHMFRIEGSAWTCGVAELKGIAGQASTVQQLTPLYDNCAAFGYQNIEFDFNGCVYDFHAVGKYDLACPAGSSLEVRVKGANTSCLILIREQDGINGVSYSNNGAKNQLTVTHASSNINYEVAKSTGFCPLKQGAKGSNAEYFGATALKANGGSGNLWLE